MVLGYNQATGTCTGITRIAGTPYDGTYQALFVVPNDWAPGDYSIKVEYPPPEQQWSWDANWTVE